VSQQLGMYRMIGSRLCEISDREHVQIRREHEELRKVILSGGESQNILEAATDLILTTLLHFESEERAMSRSSHPLLLSHLKLHAEIIESLRVISMNLHRGELESALELLKLFDGRLTYHLEVEDAEIERILAN
jgi:hemerythrin-like metal-binding protein